MVPKISEMAKIFDYEADSYSKPAITCYVEFCGGKEIVRGVSATLGTFLY